MSLYRVHFQWKGKEVLLSARQLDLTHPYFVSIKDLIFPKNTRLIIDPSGDEVRKELGNANHLMIPFQSVSIIEELPEDEGYGSVRSFEILESEEKPSK